MGTIKEINELRGFVSGTYTGTGTEITLDLGFKPKYIEITLQDSGEIIKKYDNQETTKCFLYKQTGTDMLLKSYLLTDNGITFNDDSITIGTSTYINEVGVIYNFMVWG